MPRSPLQLAIDARPRGPRGPLAVEPLQGRRVVDHLIDHVDALDHGGEQPIAVHVTDDLRQLGGEFRGSRFIATGDAPAGGAWVLRSDRVYDRARLRYAYRRGHDPETAVIWRLDTPHGLAGADDELVRRQSYQPLGRYWALGPARTIAQALAPTRVRPNAVTLTASGLFLGATAVVAFARPALVSNSTAAAGLALALVLDTADGHLARLQGTASSFGQWLDGWLDEVGDMALHAAIAWAAFLRTGAVAWLLLGMLYAMGKYAFVAATAGDDAAGTGGETTAPAARARSEPLPVRWVRLAGHADLRWHLWIVLAALGRLDVALAAYAVYFPLRALLVAGRKAVRHG